MAGMSSTIWPARLSRGHRILCGRQVDGRFDCQGELAYAIGLTTVSGDDLTDFNAYVGAEADSPAPAPYVSLPPGMTEDPPGSGSWRMTTRARGRQGEGRSGRHRGNETFSLARRRPGEGAVEAAVTDSVPLPIRRRCPHCGALAEITADVLR
jgi:hypothetical protein